MNRQNDNNSRKRTNNFNKGKDKPSAKSKSNTLNKRKEDSKTHSKNSFRPRSDSPSLFKKYPHPKLMEKLPDLNREDIRLNKFLSNAGIASRREADVLIEAGNVSVNGQIITQLGYKVLPTDEVRFDGQLITPERKRYVLLNKPKGFITTMHDPNQRHTVMELVKNACKERIYPVGRLDKETTGILLFTNDGDMAKRLTHPRHQIKKIYQVETDRPFLHTDLEQLRLGVHLEDGFIKCDNADYVANGRSNQVGVEIHSGKNRIVRRIFEKLGYHVEKLDRVQFAGLTKKDLPRGNYRFLTENEVSFLKMLS